MKTTEKVQVNNAEMVTISRAEYEKIQAQSKRISKLESRVDLLMEALRLARHICLWLYCHTAATPIRKLSWICSRIPGLPPMSKYSVPYDLIGEKVNLRLTPNTVEVFLRGSRFAIHVRSKVFRREPVVKPEHSGPDRPQFLRGSD